MTGTRPAIDAVSDLVLLVLLENERRGGRVLSGITRLQKLVFLITQSPEYAELERKQQAPSISFEPYRMGPFTTEIYEAVEVLRDFRPSLLAADRGSQDSADDVELDRYLDEVDLERSEPAVTSDPRPTTYELTKDGRLVAIRLATDLPQPLLEAIRRIITEYGSLSLTELLRRVYRLYPKMTVRSEILPQLGLG